ncbi:SusD/RagB family nutrient-binding outer membrane lipoprotein [Lunatimonas sp.]|uniref:SusD/RagB family nutrient-binding outer membrane lipoprotein n=1 Tax=Lunatimonas sp. TaxID=2060141 RepID=UPI00263AEF26|nr:SusD/RagB family nutrient-binding outer membrane lipoprotein [Lunatimonas sp.]
MKIIYKFSVILILSSNICFIGCSDLTDLAELNRNPDAFEEVVPEFLFTNSQLIGAAFNFTNGADGQHFILAQAMQHFATHSEVRGTGDKYFNESMARSHWAIYSTSLMDNERVIETVKDDPNKVNMLSAARIWKTYMFHIVTDVHGDVPYSQALKVLDGNIRPVYDTQEDIYLNMLQELEEAALAFNPALPTFGNSDLFYAGDIVKWRKFSYSLMLRLAMRLTEVRPDIAEAWVKKAITGGVILADNEIAKLSFEDGPIPHSRNPKAAVLLQQDYQNPQAGISNTQGGKYAETLIDHLKNTGDPRLNVIAVVWLDAPGGTGYVYDTTTVLQRGMKNGAFFGEPDDFQTYSEPHPNTILNFASPILTMTNAETHLLLAEASLRGWYSGDAKAAYEDAVRAGMRQWALFGDEGFISGDKIESYVRRNPYLSNGTFEEKLEQISTQKWVSLLLDNYEIFANWRRTNYPRLIPTNYPGNITGGTIPRRLIIPDSEIELNQDAFYAAYNRQNVGNLLTSTVWWDPQYQK